MNVEIKGLKKEFKDTVALREVSLKIKSGDFVTILGPSGCGKSTMLSIIAGLQRQDGGSILFDDKIIDDLKTQDRNVGMVFQSYALYPHKTVFKNIAFPLVMKKVPKSEIKDRVERIAEVLRIEELLDRKPSQLSGGQQQRVAIGRALVKEPSLLLMDEPLSNLDAKLRIETRQEIKKLQRDFGITTIFVTHDQEEALSISDKVVLMNEGSVQQYATPIEIYSNPQNLFAANFIGEVASNELKIGFEDDKWFIEGTRFRLNMDSLMNKSNTYIAMVRPENLKLSDKENYDIYGSVEGVELVGKDKIVTVKFFDQKIKVYIDSKIGFDLGKIIYLKILRTSIFEVESGKSLGQMGARDV